MKLVLVLGKKYLVTTNDWFMAPDGRRYRAVFGTARGAVNVEEALGVGAGEHLPNWCTRIGGMVVAGDQIRYCVRADSVTAAPEAGKPPVIYEADEEFSHA